MRSIHFVNLHTHIFSKMKSVCYDLPRISNSFRVPSDQKSLLSDPCLVSGSDHTGISTYTDVVRVLTGKTLAQFIRQQFANGTNCLDVG